MSQETRFVEFDLALGFSKSNNITEHLPGFDFHPSPDFFKG